MKELSETYIESNKKDQTYILKQLEKELHARMTEKNALELTYLDKLRQFELIRKNRFYSFLKPNEWKSRIRTIGAYILGRRNLKRLYSATYKNKQASNDLKPIIASLYEAGFIEESLQQLKELYWNSDSKYQKRATAWELLFWYANKQTKVDAQQALLYFFDALYGEPDEQVFIQKVIVIAECFQRIDMHDLAKAMLQLLGKVENANLSLAKANVEERMDARLSHINKALAMYKLEPIQLMETYDIAYKNLYVPMEGQKIDGPTVSIIMPAYNAEDYVATAIESLLDQTWNKLELVIVDDCSTDRTYDIIQGYANKYTHIKVFQTPTNSGAYIARNIGLKEATGEYITINDADDWSHPRKIEIQMKHLLEHPDMIANTSQLSRVTEDLYAYRRGTRGNYIFSNMSSLLFKKEDVMDSIGYWDKVRFAGDGEFKRRLIRYFGKEKVVDLQTGPLSLPLQSKHSLTSSSTFGYHGAFIGARKEYVESFEYNYTRAEDLFYPFEETKRSFPVPYPMLPNRSRGARFIDVVMIDDFYHMSEEEVSKLMKEIQWNKKQGWKTGLVQMHATYPITKKTMHPKIREAIDGDKVQMLVYGEIIQSDLQIVRKSHCLQFIQQYIPVIRSIGTIILIDEIGQKSYNDSKTNFRKYRNNHITYFNKSGLWIFMDEKNRQHVLQDKKNHIGSVTVASVNWDRYLDEESYIQFINRWKVTNTGGGEVRGR